MADRSDLEAAASAGVINAEQVGPLHDFLASRGASLRAAPGGEEDLRFIRNFHDVFLAIGIILFAIGLAVAIGTYVAGADTANEGAGLTGLLAAGSAAIMWGLGEIFARRRRLFLPAIAIVIALTLFSILAAAALYIGFVLGQGFDGAERGLESMPPELRNGILIAMAFGVLAPLAFYARFRLPFSIGLAGGGLASFVIVAALIWNFQQTVALLPALYLGLGLLLFSGGVAFDARDPQRNSRFSDNGFWLHFAAAPLVLTGAFGLIGQAFGDTTAMTLSPTAGLMASSEGATVRAAATLLVVAVLGFVSLLINRRVLIVSALLTTGVAIGILLNAVGLGAGALAASNTVPAGAFVLILGAGWHSVRRALLAWVRPDGPWARIFPPVAPAP